MEVNIEYESTLDLAEMLIIKRDIDLLKKLVLNLDPSLQYQLIPNLSLMCHEAIVWMNRKGFQVDIEQTGRYSMKDVRNKAKFFDLSFNKVMNSTRNIDAIQNYYFISMMGYVPARKYEAHTNLGIFYDTEGNIVGNTQYDFYVFQDEKMISDQSEKLKSNDNLEIELNSNDICSYAYDLGGIIGSISDGFSSIKDFIVADINPVDIEIKAQDFNTNRCLGKQCEDFKVVRLFLLHTVSNTGYTLFVLKKKILRESGLLLRLEYIAYHYVCMRLQQLWRCCNSDKQNVGDPNLIEVLNAIKDNDNSELRSSSFRNCMMHFGLRDKAGTPLIDEPHFNLAIPFCGLVESQFDMTYFEYQKLIEDQLLYIHNALSEYLDFQLL